MAHGYFPDRRDMRMGGNMERANVGAQYTGASRDFYGGPSKGSPMIDIRYENYQAPHRVDYTRNAPPQSSGTPNFRPPYGAPGQPSYGYWQQQIDPFHTGPYPPKKHPNPRRRGRGRGMAGGIRGLQEEAKINLQDVQDRIGGDINWNKFFRDLDARGIDYAGNNTGIGSTNEYQMAELSDKQGNWMDSPIGNPNWYSNFPDYFDTVTGKGDWKQKLGWKDKATEQEVIDKLNQMMLDRGQSLPWSTTT